jgi:hypothetical protein
MFKKSAVLIISVFFLANIYGCLAVMAGAAGGAGTAMWVSGKLTQEFHATQEQCVSAVKGALKSLSLDVEKETVKKDVAQIISKYTDGRMIWIDIHRITNKSQRIAVRVGAAGDKEAAHKIMENIERRL